MATLKCPIHGPQQDTGQKFCPTCMEFLVPCTEPLAPEPPAADADRCTEPGCDMPLVNGLCSVHSLELPSEPRATTRDDGGEGSASMLFPWGSVAVGSDQVWIGRSSDCGPIAAQVEPYSNVSRRHAVIWQVGAELWIRDQHSLNGTYVNDRKLTPGKDQPLHHGDVIRFAADLRATIQVRQENP